MQGKHQFIRVGDIPYPSEKAEGKGVSPVINQGGAKRMKIGELKDIDYEWYIAEAQKRVNDFLGIKPEKKTRKKKVE